MDVIENEIESRKDRLDLKPGVDFVSDNKHLYEKALQRILDREPSSFAQKWVNGIEFRGVEHIVQPQVSENEIREILMRMPRTLLLLSDLQCIDYAGWGERVVIVPVFGEEGEFLNGESVPLDEFPRKGDHPTRVLVGYCEGDLIVPSLIPPTVSDDDRAVYLYQVHVLLHEFFHTIEFRKRNRTTDYQLVYEGKEFSFFEWIDWFAELILSGDEPRLISSYAATYRDSLTDEVREENPEAFQHALIEQICETFVAYQLGIVSNSDGWTDFQSESFGNVEQSRSFEDKKSPSVNKKWLLMDMLCNATLV